MNLEQAKTRIKELEKALRFYAYKENYEPKFPQSIEDFALRPLGLSKTNCFPPVKDDGGKIARVALGMEVKVDEK